jgi:hypothetical protein
MNTSNITDHSHTLRMSNTDNAIEQLVRQSNNNRKSKTPKDTAQNSIYPSFQQQEMKTAFDEYIASNTATLQGGEWLVFFPGEHIPRHLVVGFDSLEEVLNRLAIESMCFCERYINPSQSVNRSFDKTLSSGARQADGLAWFTVCGRPGPLSGPSVDLSPI